MLEFVQVHKIKNITYFKVVKRLTLLSQFNFFVLYSHNTDFLLKQRESLWDTKDKHRII